MQPTSFEHFCTHTRNKDDLPLFRGNLVCFDPGETTGFAAFEDQVLSRANQIPTHDMPSAVELIFKELRCYDPKETHVVIEDYRVYGWKTEQHAFAELHTPKLIGALVAICTILGLPYTLQMAQQAKGFCTDAKLRAFGFYNMTKGMRHSRDAIRHGMYYQLFNKDVK